ncbi:conserved exported protein of unknown function [Tenacibaculum soleae]|uniref:hypothetical protein n=1 Tax=Tenacibaculum soleae TaxID=447689 RepID=UPI003AB55E86
MKKNILFTFIVFMLTTTTLFSQGFKNARTTQILKFPTSEIVTEGKARIYLIRTNKTLRNYSVTAYLNHKVIGTIGPKSYLLFEVDSNREIVIGTAYIGNSERKKNVENQEFVTVNPKSGKTYFIGVKAKFGTFRGRTEMTVLNKKEAEKMIPKFKKPKINYIE